MRLHPHYIAPRERLADRQTDELLPRQNFRDDARFEFFGTEIEYWREADYFSA